MPLPWVTRRWQSRGLTDPWPDLFWHPLSLFVSSVCFVARSINIVASLCLADGEEKF